MIKNLYRYIWKISGRQQLVLSLLSIAVFLMELVPLELQRRIINGVVAHHEYQAIGLLCLIYVGVTILHGGIKLLLNVYGASVGEAFNRRLRLGVDPMAASSPAKPGTHTEEGVAISILVSEAEAIGGFIATSFSAPLLNAGILLSVLGYMLFTQPWLAAVAALVFVSQVMFIPFLQAGINDRTTARIEVLRAVSIDVVKHAADRAPVDAAATFPDRVAQVYRLSMQIFRRKHGMKFLMNLCYHFGLIGILSAGGWLVLQGKADMGAVVAFISGLNRMNDPWGDLVTFFREVTNTGVRFNMIAAHLPDNAEVSLPTKYQPAEQPAPQVAAPVPPREFSETTRG